MSVERYQVVVVGAGLVGASAALALARQGLRVALVERQPPQVPDETWDTRIYAISPASQRFLERLGVWQRLDASRIQPVFRMDVAGDRFGAVRLDAYEAGVSHLATIAEAGRLQNALWRALTDADIALRCPAAIDSIRWGEPWTKLSLAGGSVLEAELVVGADGAASPVRQSAGLGSTVTPYGQSGVVANFSCQIRHRGTAFQWFFDRDILALLPLSGNRVSMVWSTRGEHADELVALHGGALAEKVQAASRGTLGTLQPLTAAAAFPLRLVRADKVVAPGLALIGDAAHGVHPLAGQGVNLGFGDAEALVGVLTQYRRNPCGDLRVLQRYARERAEPVRRMQAVTHGLHHLFGEDRAAWLRNAGMQFVDRLPPLKAALVREAMS